MASERITIIIETDNAAFEDGPATEIARILKRAAAEFEEYGEPPSGILRDINGNACGSVRVRKQR